MNYHDISYPDQNNGDGLRVVLWLSGCSHKCKGCQNPQTWDVNCGIPFDQTAKDELFRELSKDYISGLTLSGGDPLNKYNLDDVLDLVTEFNNKFSNKTIWLYTGYKIVGINDKLFVLDPNVITDRIYEPQKIENRILEDTKRSNIIKQCDVVIDGQYVEQERDVTLKWRGSANQRVIDIKQSIKQNKIVLYCD